MNISRNKYLLKSTLPLPELKKRLKHNTLDKNNLTKEKTGKAFIGKVTDDGFVFIDSKGLGVICAIQGKFNPEGKGRLRGTGIAIETKIQKVFFIMMAVWFVLMIIMAIIFPMIKNPGHPFPMIPAIIIVLGVLALRVLLHGLYLIARDRALKRFGAVIAPN